MDKQTLKDVEVGDQVLCVGLYHKRILTVTRLTNTTIICGFEKFRKDSGNSIPLDAWNHSCIEILTPEKRLQLELQEKQFKLAKKCSQASYHLFSIDTLEAISNLIEQENQNVKKSCLTQ